MEAQKEIESEDHNTDTNSKMRSMGHKQPELVPVMFGKRKESDIFETHRGNYKRHWEPSSR